ncbi:MAG: YaiI/YqxD family protein [Ectobacillus sp.]
MPKINRIFVDADACPVKEEIIQVSSRFHIDVYFVASYAHQSNNQQGNWIYVDSVKDEADFYIYKHTKNGDLVVTHDMGLAGLLLKQGIQVLSPRGTLLKDEQMDTILYSRYVSAKLRRKGTFTKGPKAFSKEDRKRFLDILQKILSNHEGIV